MIRNLFASGVGMAIRLGAGLVVFLVLARALGPEGFGAFGAALAAGTLLGLIANLGLSMMVLRDAALTGMWQSTVADALAARSVTVLIVLLVTLPVAWLLPAPLSWAPLLVLAVIGEGYLDLQVSALRARQDHAGELRAVLWLSAASLVLVPFVLAMWRSVLGAAVAYMVPRLILGFWAAAQMRRAVQGSRAAPLAATWARTKAHFAELCLQTALIQSDALLLAAVAGVSQSGVYQAVMRVVHALSQAISVVTNVFIPRAAAADGQAARIGVEIAMARRMLLGAALLLSTPLVIAPAFVTQLLLGPKFAEAAELMPWAAIVLVLRFGAAGEGIRMIVMRESRRRVLGLALALLVAWSAGAGLGLLFGAKGMLAALAAAFATIWLVAAWSRGPKATG